MPSRPSPKRAADGWYWPDVAKGVHPHPADRQSRSGAGPDASGRGGVVAGPAPDTGEPALWPPPHAAAVAVAVATAMIATSTGEPRRRPSAARVAGIGSAGPPRRDRRAERRHLRDRLERPLRRLDALALSRHAREVALEPRRRADDQLVGRHPLEGRVGVRGAPP